MSLLDVFVLFLALAPTVGLVIGYLIGLYVADHGG